MRVVVVGGGPAGLMAAEMLSGRGLCVDVYDAMPSVGRKFLLAGKGGLNLTHSEASEPFLGRYGSRRSRLQPVLEAFGPSEIREWARGLGVETFVGSSGRVFPTDMKAAPLLRSWLRRLKAAGVNFHQRCRWLGWGEQGELRFSTHNTPAPAALVLALGGGSWARLGSDGAWVPLLENRGLVVSPLRPANCGFEVAWSDYFRERFAGHPLKSVQASFEGHSQRGEFVISHYGVEGSLIYALSAWLRDALQRHGQATLELDLAPDVDPARLLKQLSQPRGSRSLAKHLGRVGMEGVKAGLLREVLSPAELSDPTRVAAVIKAMPVRLQGPRPLDEAISSAGGVPFEALDERLMIKALPGIFCAGEMLDWEAPTGGYLLSACLASGRAAGLGAAAWLESRLVL